MNEYIDHIKQEAKRRKQVFIGGIILGLITGAFFQCLFFMSLI